MDDAAVKEDFAASRFHDAPRYSCTNCCTVLPVVNGPL